MTSKSVFNRGISSGEAFCNRTEELKQLLKNASDITHSLLISPRRYGKTSLALRAIEQSHLPHAYLDLFMKYEADAILEEFYEGIGKLISKIMKPSERALKKAEALLRNIALSLQMGEVGLEFRLAPKVGDKRKSLKSLLVGLDEILKQNKKNAILFIDEIQSIVESPFCDEVEASIRFVAQKTENISFIFSGSNRHLLGKIFDDRSRPFYKLCYRMPLHRISKHHYDGFINKFAQKKWGKLLSEEALEKIFLFTKRHPYYINILCSYLFDLSTPPKSQDVDTCWKRLCYEEQGSVARDIEFLTSKQKYLLSEIARHEGLKEPTAKSFVDRVSLTPKGVLGALEILYKHDLIEKSESGEIHIIDPVLAFWISS